MDIKPGFYIARYENEPDSVLIANVYGREGFYRVDTYEPIIAQGGVVKANHDMGKKPLVFTERLIQFDKEGV
jgi:hypothetical protein